LDPIPTKDRAVDDVMKEAYDKMSDTLKSIKTVPDTHRKMVSE
jgi:hypothetical protein